MPYGYHGKVLVVNLTDSSLDVETPDGALYRRYLGGGALATHYLLRELRPGVDPLGPDNVLVFASSVISGTPCPGAARFTTAAKSPLTGGFGESEAGGWWGPEFKAAGFDAIVIKGRAPHPVYLWITNGRAELRDASAVYGRTTADAQDIIRTQLGEPKARIAQIGPAGERLVRYACVLNELKHANGRTGMGAVLGSKNLRAVAVRGTLGVPVANRKAAREIVQTVVKSYTPDSLQDVGTARGVRPFNAGGILPTRNFREGAFEQAESITGEAMRDTILTDRGTCYACPVRCKREVKVDEPWHVDPTYGGPEYETIGAFGSACGIGDLGAIAKANEICNAYGMDTISAGLTVAFAMECFEHGLLTKADTGGLDLRFGNGEAMVAVVQMIADRRGLGDLLAEGSKRAAARIGRGAEQFAMQIKGQELPLHEPRGKPGVGLEFAVSPTGADHLEGPHDVAFERPDQPTFAALAGIGPLEPIPALEISARKGRRLLYLQNLWSLYNSIGLCLMMSAPNPPFKMPWIVDYLNAVTGWDVTVEELMRVGERATTMARIFNVREGFGPADDTLPERLFSPLEAGALKGRAVDKQGFLESLHAYYDEAGWDSATGVPTPERLAALGIGWAAELLK